MPANTKAKPDNKNTLNAVIIVAAGRGTRLMSANDKTPKQYMRLGDCSILQRTISQFVDHEEINLVQVVIHQDDEALYFESTQKHQKLLPPVKGGNTRQESCANGVFALNEQSTNKVLIHDAARPFVSHQAISNTLDAIKPNICALPSTSINDTIKRAGKDNLVVETVSRENLYLAQTPQGFTFQEIKTAHEKAREQNLNHFTDDAALSEHYGMKVQLIDSDAQNFKITTQDDMIYARKLLQDTDKYTFPDIRTGNGYDIHRLIECAPQDTGVILCGITLPFNKKLDGHSDADVAMHALTDAILGTIGSGDIGSHFPPSDPKWKGASSDQFLKHACDLVREKNGIFTHMDITIICEAPKIGPHKDKMRQSIAKICDIEVNRVSVKATTNEEIGSIGRQEGIASIATATAFFKNTNT
ncbi:MAG: bifunctional 2-C-methyl-D-erythritol 4-phosphate cytidylyltransferase/2-C-methyl-D-erythritol 2,4-cyclodiphosphate synthase [Nitratireductor sp.]